MQTSAWLESTGPRAALPGAVSGRSCYSWAAVHPGALSAHPVSLRRRSHLPFSCPCPAACQDPSFISRHRPEAVVSLPGLTYTFSRILKLCFVQGVLGGVLVALSILVLRLWALRSPCQARRGRPTSLLCLLGLESLSVLRNVTLHWPPTLPALTVRPWGSVRAGHSPQHPHGAAGPGALRWPSHPSQFAAVGVARAGRPCVSLPRSCSVSPTLTASKAPSLLQGTQDQAVGHGPQEPCAWAGSQPVEHQPPEVACQWHMPGTHTVGSGCHSPPGRQTYVSLTRVPAWECM